MTTEELRATVRQDLETKLAKARTLVNGFEKALTHLNSWTEEQLKSAHKEMGMVDAMVQQGIDKLQRDRSN